VLRTAPAEGLLLGFRAEYSVTAQTEPKTKTCFGLPKPRPIPKLYRGMYFSGFFFFSLLLT
jgi:hypothetical protein